jgi:hypothetical protein
VLPKAERKGRVMGRFNTPAALNCDPVNKHNVGCGMWDPLCKMPQQQLVYTDMYTLVTRDWHEVTEELQETLAMFCVWVQWVKTHWRAQGKSACLVTCKLHFN